MPHKDSIEDFLGGYMAPASDNGFTAMIMVKADAEMARVARLRRRVLNGAFFIGGFGAALQLPKLWGVMLGLSVPNIDLPRFAVPDVSALDMGAMSSSTLYAVVGGVMVSLMMGWALFADQLS